MNFREVMDRLKAEGWALRRIAGSHHIFEKDGRKVPIPVHGARDLAAGTLAAIQRQTGVSLKAARKEGR
jgi:predicted RNA binding protein YcfA (HicA-like mRNA interferase family)